MNRRNILASAAATAALAQLPSMGAANVKIDPCVVSRHKEYTVGELCSGELGILSIALPSMEPVFAVPNVWATQSTDDYCMADYKGPVVTLFKFFKRVFVIARYDGHGIHNCGHKPVSATGLVAADALLCKSSQLEVVDALAIVPHNGWIAYNPASNVVSDLVPVNLIEGNNRVISMQIKDGWPVKIITAEMLPAQKADEVTYRQKIFQWCPVHVYHRIETVGTYPRTFGDLWPCKK